jgi:hypothetical protein
MFDFVLIGIVLVGAGLVVHGTVVKNRWGINFQRPKCPRCGELPRLFRHPRTLSQALFGGWTCRNCGCEFDCWGREILTGQAREKRGA